MHGATPARNDFFLIKILQRVLLSKRTRERSGRHPLKKTDNIERELVKIRGLTLVSLVWGIQVKMPTSLTTDVK